MLLGRGNCDNAMSTIILFSVVFVQIEIAAHPETANTLTSLAEVLLQSLFHKTHSRLYYHAESVTEAMHHPGGREHRCYLPLNMAE